MKRIIIAIFSLISVLELFTSNPQGGPCSRPYNNKEILNSLRNFRNTSANKNENLTFAQQQVRKFIGQKDNYQAKK